MKHIFINPFEKHPDKLLLSIGLAAIAAGWAAGYYFNARYDGVFDLHFVDNTEPFDSLFDILISITATTLALFAAGKSFNRKTRLVDIVIACLIAKIPFYVLTVFNTNNWVYDSTSRLMSGVQKTIMEPPAPADLAPILLFSLVSLSGLVLTVTLLFNGYKVASNAKGAKSAWLFVAALLIAEIISKVLIAQL